MFSEFVWCLFLCFEGTGHRDERSFVRVHHKLVWVLVSVTLFVEAW